MFSQMHRFSVLRKYSVLKVCCTLVLLDSMFPCQVMSQRTTDNITSDILLSLTRRVPIVINPTNYQIMDSEINDVISHLLQRIGPTNRSNQNSTNVQDDRQPLSIAINRPTPSEHRTIVPSEIPINSPRNMKEGKLRLVGGRTLFEGNVEINHLGQWGSICDDEWDINEANIACRQLGFVLGALVATTNSKFGKSRKLIWMDSLFCSGNESSIQNCPFDGWKNHDCSPNEAAGVVCRTRLGQSPIEARTNASNNEKINIPEMKRNLDLDNEIDKPKIRSENLKLKSIFGEDIQVRIVGGIVDHQGRVEILVNNRWHVTCGDGWGLNEANIVCRQLNLGFADSVLHLGLTEDQHEYTPIFSGIQCNGHEQNVSECFMAKYSTNFCTDSYNNLAGVTCVPDLPDLVPNAIELEKSAFLEDRSIMFLQCAMEENCLSRSAYEIDKNDPMWVYETRRLLRFTASIKNTGRVNFRPFAPKHTWVWHSCHRHYHSMEVFAHFDIIDQSGHRIAEGHKASFCLEDNECDPGHKGSFVCADFGDQGISVGCVDIYKYDLDCQWIDITDIQPGNYYLKITINPEFKVPELSYDNNAVLCHFTYTLTNGHVTNCTVVSP